MRRARHRALVLGSVTAGLATLPLGVAVAQEGPPQREALVVLVPDTTFDEMLGIPDVAALARAGGAALLVDPNDVATIEDTFVPGENRLVLDPDEPGALSAYARDLPRPMASEQPEELLVIVMGGVPRHAAGAKPLSGVVVAQGPPGELFPEAGSLGSLTSDSTRRDGVVTGPDVETTLRLFLGREAMEAGTRIRPTGTEAPFALYDRSLAQRRMYVPVGTAGALYLTAVGVAGIAALALGRAVPTRWRRAIGWAAFSVAMLSTAMLAAGHLPELSYATAVPFIAIVTVLGTMAFSPLERASPTLVPAGIGVAVLVFFVVELFTGWSGMLTPLLGGSQLDGGRFYGFPNVAIGLTIGATLWATHRLPTPAGLAALFGLGMFIGLPYLGSNLGGAVSAFVAAGLWLAVRERDRLGPWKGIGVVAAIAAVGGALILLAHAIAPLETHISAFEERVSGIGGVVGRFVDRLGVGIDLIARAPAALVPVLGLPVLVVVVLRPPAPIRATFARWPAWRDAILVTTLAGVVAYVVNDSGPAAAGLAFGLALGGTLGVSLLAAPEKMAER